MAREKYIVERQLAEWTDEELLAELRRVADVLRKDSLSGDEFNRHSKLNRSVYKKRFGTWNKALLKAGLKIRKRLILHDEEIFREIERVWDSLGHEPSKAEFDRMSNISSATIKTRFHGFRNALRVFADKGDRALGEASGKGALKTPPLVPPRQRSPEYGDYINFRGMMHAPLNEQGVVFLFGMVSKELGFIVEAARSAFPDCEAKRILPKTGKYVRSEIEFEFKSSNYRDHKHPLNWEGVWLCAGSTTGTNAPKT